MSQTDSARYLITYDIADKRRLGRVFRLLKKHGLPVQYSVFFVHSKAPQISALMQQLARLSTLAPTMCAPIACPTMGG